MEVCFNCDHNERDQGTRKVAVILQTGHELYLQGSVGSRAKTGSHSAKPFCELLGAGGNSFGNESILQERYYLHSVLVKVNTATTPVPGLGIPHTAERKWEACSVEAVSGALSRLAPELSGSSCLQI